MGKVATSPLPPRGSPPLQSGGQNQKWPINGQGGYITPDASGIPTASERGAKSEVAHKWARWLHHPCRLGDPHRLKAGGKIRSRPLMGKVATSPLPPRGSPPLHGRGRNQKWPIHGQCGYINPAASGITTASGQGAKSEVPHKWARWLRHPCRLGDPHRFRAGGETRSGPYMGNVATSPLPPRGSPPLQSGGAKSEVAHTWARWLHHPCRLGDPHRFRAGGKIRSGPYMGKVATSPLPPRGSPGLQSGGRNEMWPINGQGGYTTPTASGIPTASKRGAKSVWPINGQGGYVTRAASGMPTASKRGAKSEVAHKWARWRRNPCRLGDPHPFKAGGQKQKWPIHGQSGYITPAASGIPTASGRGAKSQVAHKWARWLHPPCRLGDPHRFRAGGQIRSGQEMGKVATSPLPPRGSAPLRSGRQNQKWPIHGQGGYVTPAASGMPTASKREAKSEVAHKWARWLHHPCRLGDPHRFRAGGKIRSGP